MVLPFLEIPLQPFQGFDQTQVYLHLLSITVATSDTISKVLDSTESFALSILLQ
jgi:hypothetical protein